MSPAIGRMHRAVPALLAAVVIWGATYVITKQALADLGPFTILVIRFGTGWLLLWAVAAGRGYSPKMSLEPRFLVFGLTGIVLHNGLETMGLVFTSAGSAALVIASAPAVTAAMSFFVLKERIRRIQAAGIAASVGGVILITAQGAGGSAGPAIAGNVLVFAGVVAWAVYSIQGKRITTGLSGLVATAAGAGGALIFLLPLAFGELVVTGVPSFTPGALLSVAYLGALASAAAYGLWNYALEHVDASVAAPFLNLVPVIGLVLAIAAGEPTDPIQIAGGLTVGVGVWLSTDRATRERSLPAARRRRADLGMEPSAGA